MDLELNGFNMSTTNLKNELGTFNVVINIK